MNIQGVNMRRFYRVCVEKAEPSPEFTDIGRFRIALRPLDYCAAFATTEREIYSVPAVRQMFAEDTARKFAEHILKEMPAEIEKLLEAQI
jgi:hypothetical protein